MLELIKIYGASWCKACLNVRSYLYNNKIKHEYIDLGTWGDVVRFLRINNLNNVPVLYDNGVYIVGEDDIILYLTDSPKKHVT